MKSSEVAASDTAVISQYNDLRDDARGASFLSPHEQDTPDMTIYIENGRAYVNGTEIDYAGGSTATISAPSTNPRIDVVYIDESGTIGIETGSEAASPTAPDLPQGVLGICHIHLPTTATAIYTDSADAGGTHGYILRDIRPTVSNAGNPFIRNFTLFEDLTAEDVVRVINDSGAKIQSLEKILTAGTKAKFSTGSVFDVSLSYDSGQEKIILFYRDTDNSSYGTSVVGTITPGDNTVSWGTPVVFNSASSVYCKSAFDSNAGKSVVFYSDGGNSSHGYAKVCTISGTTPSFGTGAAFHTGGGVIVIGAEYDANAQKILVASKENYSPNYGNAIVGTISGTSISFGSETAFASEVVGTYGDVCYDSNAQKLVIAFIDSSNYGSCIVGTISGTSVSFGTAVDFTSANTQFPTCSFDSNANKVLIAYQDTANSNYGTMIVGTVSGTSISYGSEVVFASEGIGNPMGIAFSTTFNEFVISFIDSSNDFSVINASISGTTPSSGTKSVLLESTVTACDIAYDANADRMLAAARDTSDSGDGISYVVEIGADGDGSFGILLETGSASDSKPVAMLGGVIPGLTSLTPGSTYYIQADGTISTTSSNWRIGVAISATELLSFKEYDAYY